MITELRVDLEPCFHMCTSGEISPLLLVIPLPLLGMKSIGPSYPFFQPSDLPTWLSSYNLLLDQILIGGLGELDHC